MYNKIKRELYATDCECSEIKFYTADRLPCFGCQMFKKWPFKLGGIYQTAHQNDGFHALRLCCSKLNPACLCYDSKPAKLHKARWAIQLLIHLLGLPNRASLRLFQGRSSAVTFILKFFPHRIVNLLNISSVSTELRHFSQRFRRIQSWYYYRFHLHDARLLADDLNFDLTFVTRDFIGSCVIRCVFWLVSRKDHCLERVIRKCFWIKKSINKIPFICRTNFEKYFIKAIENFFPVFA